MSNLSLSRIMAMMLIVLFSAATLGANLAVGQKSIARYKIAVKQGNGDAQNNLGFVYANGKGVGGEDLKAQKSLIGFVKRAFGVWAWEVFVKAVKAFKISTGAAALKIAHVEPNYLKWFFKAESASFCRVFCLRVSRLS